MIKFSRHLYKLVKRISLFWATVAMSSDISTSRYFLKWHRKLNVDDLNYKLIETELILRSLNYFSLFALIHLITRYVIKIILFND